MLGRTLFNDRIDAGSQLAVKLKPYAGQDAVVLALPRGGVVLGKQISDRLDLPLGLILVSKIGHPLNPEYAIGAISLHGRLIANESEFRSVDKDWLKKEMQKQKDKLKHRQDIYLSGKDEISLKGKIAIIVDDGVATGLTLLAAIADIQKQSPKKIVVAVPVSPDDTAEKIRAEVDEAIFLEIPQFFLGAVGAYYHDFPQVSDEEVIALLGDNQSGADPTYLFHSSEFNDLARRLGRSLKIKTGKYRIKRFADQEMKVEVQTDIKGNTALVLGNISSEIKMVEMLFLCHTLKKEGAKKIILVCPYLAYQRQDKPELHASLAADLIAKLFESIPVDKIITIDIHSVLAERYFRGRIVSLSSAPIFAPKLSAKKDFSLVAPDEGALDRTRRLASLLKIKKPLAFFRKQRLKDDLKLELEGKVSDRVIITDDILSTGQTLVKACRILQGEGVKEIIICVTHGLFIGSAWKKLWSLGVKKIYVADTCPRAKRIDSRKIVSVSSHDLLVGNIKKYL